MVLKDVSCYFCSFLLLATEDLLLTLTSFFPEPNKITFCEIEIRCDQNLHHSSGEEQISQEQYLLIKTISSSRTQQIKNKLKHCLPAKTNS